MLENESFFSLLAVNRQQTCESFAVASRNFEPCLLKEIPSEKRHFQQL
jgi:hypothetical protein